MTRELKRELWQERISNYRNSGLNAQAQHFSLYHSQTIDYTGIFADFKSVSNSGFF